MKKVKLLISSLSLVAMNVFATDVYVTVSGAGNGSGSDWANAKTTWEKFSIMLLPGRRFMSEPEFINRQ